MNDKQLFAIIQQIGEYIHKTVAEVEPGNWMGDRRQDGVNPFYSQTKSGLFLELYYGMPSKLWTPWGYWSVSGSGAGHFERVIEALHDQLELREHTPLQTTHMGEYGPVYSIHSFRGKKLPEPVVQERAEYKKYEQANKEWEALEKQA